MPSNPAALEALRKLAQPQPKIQAPGLGSSPDSDMSFNPQPHQPDFDSSSQDPTVGRYLAQQDIKSGVEDQITGATKARGYALASPDPRQAQAYEGDISGLKQLLGSTQDDLNENPITKQLGMVNDTNDANQHAILSGFLGGSGQGGGEGMNPIQQQARFGQNLEVAKTTMPLDVARINTAGAGNVANITGEANVKAAQARADSYNSRTASQQLIALDKNITAIKVAQARNPRALAAIAQAEKAKDLIRQGMAVGQISEDDPGALAQIAAINAQIAQYSSPNDGSAPPAPQQPGPEDLTGLQPGQARRFTEGPFAGTRWTVGPDGNAQQLGGQ